MNIDGIDVSDMNPDRVCLNCRHWLPDVQLHGASQGVICRLTKEHTNPSDTCSQFSPNSTFDSLQDPNRYFDKKQKLGVFKRF